MRVLYVEDNPGDVLLARREIEKADETIRLDHVPSQVLAISRLVAGCPFDVVLSDIRLPDGDGFSILAHIRQTNLPLAVVLITGEGDQESAVAALKAGADDYIIKRADYLSRLPMTLAHALHSFRTNLESQAHPLRLVYAEHSTQDIEMTRRHLQQKAPHIQMDVCRSPAELLRRLFEDRRAPLPDVLLVDYRLPGASAIDLLKEVVQRGCMVPFVVVTGQGQEEVALQVLKLGAADYLIKNPGYLVKLPSVLEGAYHRARAARDAAALQASEARLRTLVEQLPAIAINSPPGEFFSPSYVSPQAESLLGYPLSDWTGKSGFFWDLIHPDDRVRVREEADRVRASGEPLSTQYRLRARDGHETWFHHRAAIVTDSSKRPLSSQGVLVDISCIKRLEKERERLNGELRMDRQMLHYLSQRLLTAQEAERRSIARELHDEIGQVITTLKLSLQGTLNWADALGKRPLFEECLAIVDRTLEQVRNLSLNLRPPLLDDLGLEPALRWYLEKEGKRAGYRFSFRSNLSGQRPSPPIETACFRVAQEALTNIARHASARVVTVEVVREGDDLQLSVRDDGSGFDLEAARFTACQGTSLGLLSMEERVRLTGGRFEILTAPGRGTRIQAWFPFQFESFADGPRVAEESVRNSELEKG